MSDLRDVSPFSHLTGMTVLSLATGNSLGRILDLYIDPVNGVLVGVTLSLTDGGIGVLAQAEIHSFGQDAVMAKTDHSITPLDAGGVTNGRPGSKLIGTKIITDSGEILGEIMNIFVTLKPPPQILYEARHSFIDKLLGRGFFVPASVGHALSDDSARLVVPDITKEIAASDLSKLVDQNFEVRSFDPAVRRAGSTSRDDDTVVIRMDEDETVVRFGDDDDTVVRQPRRPNQA